MWVHEWNPIKPRECDTVREFNNFCLAVMLTLAAVLACLSVGVFVGRMFEMMRP